MRTRAPPVPAAHPGAAPLSDTLVAGGFRPRRLHLMTGQEAPAAECVEEAAPCWELLEECTISSGTSAHCDSTWVRGELITVSSVLTCQT